jgi:hypothetical protein
MLKQEFDERNFFHVSCGGWESVVLASDRSSALVQCLEEGVSPDRVSYVSPVLTCLDVTSTSKEISLEHSLKFIPVREIIPLLEGDLAKRLNYFLKDE